jgi:hypothetical protein
MLRSTFYFDVPETPKTDKEAAKRIWRLCSDLRSYVCDESAVYEILRLAGQFEGMSLHCAVLSDRFKHYLSLKQSAAKKKYWETRIADVLCQISTQAGWVDRF